MEALLSGFLIDKLIIQLTEVVNHILRRNDRYGTYGFISQMETHDL